MEVETIYGVDFSGSSTAGEKIWVTEARPGEKNLVVESVQRIDEFLDLNSTSRDIVLAELLHFVVSEGDTSVFGFDFPFSLPKTVLSQNHWWEFVVRFPDEFLSPENLQRVCSNRARLVRDDDRVQLTRKTEAVAGGLCPYNLQVSKQTYYGIRDLLRPLAVTESAKILPMVAPGGELPAVVEVYPSGTLATYDGLPERGYKSNTKSATENRQRIVDALLPEESDVDRTSLVKDVKADGIDSLVAAVAVNENLETISEAEVSSGDSIEGHIYV